MKDRIEENEIKGITGIYRAVGFETSFHDAEILSITLDRTTKRAHLDTVALDSSE